MYHEGRARALTNGSPQRTSIVKPSRMGLLLLRIIKNNNWEHKLIKVDDIPVDDTVKVVLRLLLVDTVFEEYAHKWVAGVLNTTQKVNKSEL
ncbi:hypothetical protein J6590_046295 [Homalodisca vitripennis]|nr:hypothetical protein J6590_046295 [Homalodisca vitripennis]